MKPLYIGIDTGRETGLAVWDPDLGQFTELRTLGAYAAMKEVLSVRREANGAGRGIVLVFEDARLRKWIPRERSVREMKGRAMGAGSVKRDGSIWEEFCQVEEIPYFNQGPRAGMTKWSEQFFKAITGWQGRSSKHSRDAAVLVFQL